MWSWGGGVTVSGVAANGNVLSLINPSGTAQGNTYATLSTTDGAISYLYQRHGGRGGFSGSNGFSVDVYGSSNSIAVFNNDGSVQVAGTLSAAGATLSGPLSATSVTTTGGATFGGAVTATSATLPNSSTDSTLKIGTLEFQSYALGNSWFGDNLFFNGSGFQRRQVGAGGLFYFASTEGQFRFYPSGPAGGSDTTYPVQFKVNANGTVALGGTINSAIGDTTGATLVVTPAGAKLNGPLNLSVVNTSTTPGTVDLEYATDSATGKLAQWSASAGIWHIYT